MHTQKSVWLNARKNMKKYLQLLDEPREEMDEKGNKTLTGMTYSDAMVLLKWYKSMPG